MILTKTEFGSDTDIIFQNSIGSDSKNPLSDHLWYVLPLFWWRLHRSNPANIVAQIGDVPESFVSSQTRVRVTSPPSQSHMKFFQVESESSHFESLVYKLESMSSHMKFYIFLWHFYAVKWCPTCWEMVPDKLKIENGVQCLFNQVDCRFLHLRFFNLDLFVFFTLCHFKTSSPTLLQVLQLLG